MIMTCICNDCQGRLIEFGELAFYLCELACTDYLNYGITIYDENDQKSIAQVAKFLEEKGYIYTKELEENQIGIVPNFYNSYYNEDSQKFCWCPFLDKI